MAALYAAFMCSTGYMRMVEEQNQFIELLPVGSIHSHAKSDYRPMSFFDVVIRKEKASVNCSTNVANNVKAFISVLFSFVMHVKMRDFHENILVR